MCCILSGHCELESLAPQPYFLCGNYHIISGDSQSPPSQCLWARQARSLAPRQRLPEARGLLLLLLLLLLPVHKHTTTKTHRGMSSEQPEHATHTVEFAISVSTEVSEVSEFTQSFIKS